MAGEIERHRIFTFLEERFGIPQKLFADYLLFKGSRSWALLRNDSRLMAASQLKVCKTGLKAFRKVSRYVKPTTWMIQVFGRFATKAKISLNEEVLSRLLSGERMAVPAGPIEAGYVILTLGDGATIGLGFVDAAGFLRIESRRGFIKNYSKK